MNKEWIYKTPGIPDEAFNKATTFQDQLKKKFEW